MTRDQLAAVLDRLSDLPEEAHADLVESVVQIEARFAGVYRLDEDERSALRRSADDVREGRTVSVEEVEAILKGRWG